MLMNTLATSGQQRSQPGWTGVDQHWRSQERPTALEHLNLQVVSRPSLRHARQLQAQRRRRRVVLRVQWPEDKQQLVSAKRRNLQAPQMCAPGIGQPGQHGAYIGTLQRLTRGPQHGGAVVFGIDVQHPLHVELARTQRRAKRAIRRAYQHHQCAGAGSLQRAQCRRDQAPFMLARLRLQHLGHRPARPAAARQHMAECVVTRADGLHAGGAHRARAPNVGNTHGVKR